ncbi:MAG: hypothetical protein IIB77_10165, partial [Proteobacteria bacterium]|nr:hypothetical protein [Pseudomonadota bacterium]
EYKFRAWNKDNKERLYGTPEDIFQWMEDGQPIEIMQWAGLADKTGVDIYEGDIVKDFDNAEVIVQWQEDQSRFMATREDGYGFWLGIYECEVVGNIYEDR